MLKTVGIWSLLLYALNFNAQSLHYGGLFPTVDHSAELTKKLDYSLYYFAAFPVMNFSKPDVSRDANFLLFYSEQALSYRVRERFSLTGSYVYQRTNAVYDSYINENRFYIQTKYKHNTHGFNIAHRIRFDARFIQDRFTNKTLFKHRARYLLGFDAPFKNQKFYFTMYEELFLNTVNGAQPVYEENWAYAAFGFKLNEKNKIEPGILYITWNIGNRYWFNQYYFQLTWISHLNFKKD